MGSRTTAVFMHGSLQIPLYLMGSAVLQRMANSDRRFGRSFQLAAVSAQTPPTCCRTVFERGEDSFVKWQRGSLGSQLAGGLMAGYRDSMKPWRKGFCSDSACSIEHVYYVDDKKNSCMYTL